MPLFGTSFLGGCPKERPVASKDAARPADVRQPIKAKPQRIVIKDVGFMTPESVLHDAEQDIYLVANINGDPLGVDGNGFICSRTLRSC